MTATSNRNHAESFLGGLGDESCFWIFYVVGYMRACCAWEGKVKVYMAMLGGSDLYDLVGGIRS